MKFVVFILIFNVVNLTHSYHVNKEVNNFNKDLKTKSAIKRFTAIESLSKLHIYETNSQILPQNGTQKKIIIKRNIAIESQSKVHINEMNDSIPSQDETQEKINYNKSKPVTSPIQDNIEQKINNTTSTTKEIDKMNRNSTTSTRAHSLQHKGATLRGFFVFVGLSILIIIYFLVKAFRLRSGVAPPTVRKYGVVGRRNDMEMLPLPLAEDDDDDTVFEIGASMRR